MNESNTKSKTSDIVVVGGGVVGLSIARELAAHGMAVQVVDHSTAGAASWAGAGILPPSTMDAAAHPIERIAAESFRMHGELAQELREETGIDNGFRQCGALFVARTPGEEAALVGQCTEWEQSGVRVERLDAAAFAQRAPALAGNVTGMRLAVWVPDEVQIRNPDHLTALADSCRRRGVNFVESRVSQIHCRSGRFESVETEGGQTISGDGVCLASGAWTEQLLQQTGVSISTLPVRGQMLLYRLPSRIFTQILYEGTRYMVPRDDGHVLVGSTLEQAGFDPSTTPVAVDDLRQFALGWSAELNDARLVRKWAGLRPGTHDGFPYIGQLPNLENGWAACGHFRSGLLMAPCTAVLIRQLIKGESPLFDLTPFRLGRG